MIRDIYFILCVFIDNPPVFALWMTLIIFLTKLIEIYVHVTVHLSNTSHLNTNDMQLFILFIWF